MSVPAHDGARLAFAEIHLPIIQVIKLPPQRFTGVAFCAHEGVRQLRSADQRPELCRRGEEAQEIAVAKGFGKAKSPSA